MCAECDVVLANPSDCVHHTLIMCLNECTFRQTFSMTLVFFSATTGTKFQGESLTTGIKYTRVERFCDSRPKLLFIWEMVHGRKSYVANPSVSIPVALSDPESWDAKGQIFLVDLHWLCSCGLSRMPKLGMVTQMVEKRVSNGSATPHPKELGPQHSPNFGTPTYAKTVWPGVTKFGMIVHGGRVFPGVSRASF